MAKAKAAKTTRKKVTKKKRLDAVQAAIQKKFGKHSAIRLSDGYRGEVVSSIPSGLDVLDNYVAGCGGLPVGRITEIFSEEGGGKSSLCLSMIAAAQRAGKAAILIETENGISDERARTFGVDIDDLLLLQPEYMEAALKHIEMAFDNLDPADGETLICWDSLAASPLKAELDDGIKEKAAQDTRSIILGRAMRIFSQKVQHSKVALVIVNQTRHKRGVMFGDPTTTPGGSAVKFHASLRLQIMGGKAVKDGTDHVGKDIVLFSKKNRFVVPFRKARVRLNYHTGWDNDWTTLELAKELKLIPAKSRDAEAAKAALEAIKWDPRNRTSTPDDEDDA